MSFEAIHVQVREAGAGTTRAVYFAIGINETGHTSVFGLWLGEHAGAKFWLNVLNELKVRGLQDLLIAVVDGLKGLPEALATAFPNTTVPTCLVPLLRSSLSRTSYRERQDLAAALKPIDRAENADRAESLWDEFEQSELGRRYPHVVRSWRKNGTSVIPFLAFSPMLRKASDTTHALASLNAAVRRAGRARRHFTSGGAANKLRYVALREASAKWSAPMNPWELMKREFAIHFEDRFNPSKGWLTRASVMTTINSATHNFSSPPDHLNGTKIERLTPSAKARFSLGSGT